MNDDLNPFGDDPDLDEPTPARTDLFARYDSELKKTGWKAPKRVNTWKSVKHTGGHKTLDN